MHTARKLGLDLNYENQTWHQVGNSAQDYTKVSSSHYMKSSIIDSAKV